MNFKKTKVMSNRPTEPLITNKTEIQLVDEYIYLALLVTLNDKMSKEIKRRVSQAWKAFWALKFIFLDILDRKIRLDCLDTCLMPVPLYASQTWSLTTKNKNTIEVCQRKMARKILGVCARDRISNTQLQEWSMLKSAAQQASRSKWKWAGHIARLHHTRWAQATTMWDLYRDKRSRGRLSTRWADYFNKLIGPHWSKVARDRNEWKVLGNQLNEVNHSR